MSFCIIILCHSVLSSLNFLISSTQNLKQARLFEKQVGSPKKIIKFDLIEEVMKERLKARGNFDDQEATITKRIITYQEQTKPVVEAYLGSLIKVIYLLHTKT